MGVYLLVHDLAHRQQLFHLRGGFHRVGDCPGNNRTAVSQFKIFLYITSSQGACVKCDYHHPVRSHTVYLRSSGPFRASGFFIQWLSVLPLFLISIFSLIGLGIMCASLALKYKSISSFYSMVSSIVFGILSYGAVFISSKTALTLLFPFAEANAAIQQLLLRGSSLTPNTLTVILCNDGLYLLLGYLCLKFLIIKSKESGSLSKF